MTTFEHFVPETRDEQIMINNEFDPARVVTTDPTLEPDFDVTTLPEGAEGFNRNYADGLLWGDRVVKDVDWKELTTEFGTDMVLLFAPERIIDGSFMWGVFSAMVKNVSAKREVESKLGEANV